MTTRYHSLPHVVTCCTTRYQSLSFVFTHCTTCYHSLSLVVTRCITRLSFYRQSNISINLYKFFSLGSKKEVGTSFILLFKSRNTIGRLIKTYLHRPMRILYFLLAWNFKNVSHNFKIFLHFPQYATFRLSLAYNKGFYYILFLFIL